MSIEDAIAEIQAVAEQDRQEREAARVGHELQRSAFARVLTDWGIDALTSDPPHGWRCEYPESYGQGPCDCIDRLLDDLQGAVLDR